MKTRRKIVLVLVGVVLALVAFEAALQVAAWVTWRRGQLLVRAVGDGADGAVVLCVGDSFTYGLGASSPAASYPTRLEQRLREAGKPCHVVNGGWPGQTSREVLAKLPDQLRTFGPRVVYVLVGTNDRWNPPALLPLDAEGEDRDAFRWRWRTGRFLALVVAALAPASGPQPFVGTWHQGTFEVTFAPDGRLLAGHDELRWLERDGRLHVRPPNGGELPVAWRVERGTLHLESEAWPAPLLLAAGPASGGDALRRGREALAAGDAGAAVREFTMCLERPELAVAAREGLLQALAASGGDGAPHLAWLRERAAEGDAEAGEALAAALLAFGRHDEALQAALDVARRAPERRRPWEIVAAVPLDQGSRRGDVLATLERLLAREGLAAPVRGTLLRARAVVATSSDTALALRAAFSALLADGDPAFVLQQLGSGRFSRDEVDQAITAVATSDAERHRLREIAARAFDGDRAPLGVLQQHLRRIVERCRAAGAEPVLLGYPFADAQLEAAIRAAAEAGNAAFVALAPHLAARGAAAPQQPLFVPDGHCNDAGYDVVAAALAADAARRLRR